MYVCVLSSAQLRLHSERTHGARSRGAEPWVCGNDQDTSAALLAWRSFSDITSLACWLCAAFLTFVTYMYYICTYKYVYNIYVYI